MRKRRVAVHSDDRCEIVRDGVSKEIRKHELIDPRPDTIERASTPCYKVGQKLMLVHEGKLVDIQVEGWLGVRAGSRHQVKVGVKATSLLASAALVTKRAQKAETRFEVDFNETNHARHIYPTVAKYQTARTQYLEALAATHQTVHDEVTDQDLRTRDQRLYLQMHLAEDASADTGRQGAEAGLAQTVATTNVVSQDGSSSDHMPTTDALSLIYELVPQGSESSPDLGAQPLLIRTHHAAEHELMRAQLLHLLATLLIEDTQLKGVNHGRRQVPLALPMARIAELQGEAGRDESKRMTARDMIVKVFEAEYPERGDVIRQAVEMHALVIVADIRESADLATLTDAICEEMLSHRLIIVAMREVLEQAEATVPSNLARRCASYEVQSLGLSMNEIKLTARAANALFTQMLPSLSESDVSHYKRVSALHLSGRCGLDASDPTVGAQALHALSNVLKHKACILQRLDLSYTSFDGTVLVDALKGNSSLVSLDVRCVPTIEDSFERMGDVLLQPNSQSHLAFFRCDAYEVIEGETSLSLRERTLTAGAIRLLMGLLTRNTLVQYLDLAATNLTRDWAAGLIQVLEVNTTLTTLHLPFNPAIDKDARLELTAAVKELAPDVTLNF